MKRLKRGIDMAENERARRSYSGNSGGIARRKPPDIHIRKINWKIMNLTSQVIMPFILAASHPMVAARTMIANITARMMSKQHILFLAFF